MKTIDDLCTYQRTELYYFFKFINTRAFFPESRVLLTYVTPITRLTYTYIYRSQFEYVKYTWREYMCVCVCVSSFYAYNFW